MELFSLNFAQGIFWNKQILVYILLKMSVLHELVLLSHTNNYSQKRKIRLWGQENHLALNLKGYKKSWEAFHAFALGKGIVI